MVTMTITWSRKLRTALFISVILFVFPTVLLAAGEVSSEATFFELYAKIIRAVDVGKLDKSVGNKARAINSELQKKISFIDTRLDTLKSASMKQDGFKRDMLLDDLISTGAERERVYLDYHQQLEQLNGVNNQDVGKIPSSLTGIATDQKTKHEVELEKHSSGSQAQTIQFEIVPEDISLGQFD